MRYRIGPHPERPAHPDEGALRSYLDGELAAHAALSVRRHLDRCTVCRHRLEELRTLDTRAASLLDTLSPVVPRPRSRRAWRLGLPMAAIGALAGLAIWFAAQPATHARTAGAYRVHDVCCFNLDGGERADDGLLTVSRAGEIVDCVLLYEDRAGVRRFAERDPLRFAAGPATASRCAPELLAAMNLAPANGVGAGL